MHSTTGLIFAEEILKQNIAVLGKTGSGKTSTAKLMIEQVVRAGSRVCVLDPIKSDWWGMTLDADGKRAGLPFSILGGPKGHVPLHAEAGKAVAEVVASGALPLSIIDMAEFGPGGQAQFFTEFAPMLLRKMRGVLYLVIEEAHLFAPKERSGIGQESMSIHWAKTMATAGRSKGLRLIVLTQRTQALHNAILGSCDTLIAHRLIAPADQKPVNSWLAANTDKATSGKVASSLSGLKTGHGWICSGEAGVFDLREFPRIGTYDNTKTPTGDEALHEVTPPMVDTESLRQLIGDAVAAAKADDPKELRRQIAELQQQLETARQGSEPSQPQFLDRLVVTTPQLAEATRLCSEGRETVDRLVTALGGLTVAISQAEHVNSGAGTLLNDLAEMCTRTESAVSVNHAPRSVNQPGIKQPESGISVNKPDLSDEPPFPNKAERRILTALAQHPKGRTRRQIAILTGYKGRGGNFNGAIQRLIREQAAIREGELLLITRPGLTVLGKYDPLPTGRALREYWLKQFNMKAMRVILTILCDVYPKSLNRQGIADRSEYGGSGGNFNGAIQKLKALELIEGGTSLKASEYLFD